MASDDTLWRTLVLVYGVVLAAAVCLPSATVLPLLLGLDSFVVLLCSGCFGLVLTAGVASLLVDRYDAAVATGQSGDADGATRASDGAAGVDSTMPGQPR